MPPKRRRYGTRSSSQSQSQSQSQVSPITQFTPPRQRREPAKRALERPPQIPETEPDSLARRLRQEHEPEPESLASLPPHHGVSVASDRPLTKEDTAWATEVGAAVLADCKNITTELEHLVPIPRRLGLWAPSHKRDVKGKGKAKDEGYWRTATLAYPCTCNLPAYSKGWISHPPPMSLGSGHSERLELPEWSTDLCSDPDPELDLLEEFEALWRSQMASPSALPLASDPAPQPARQPSLLGPPLQHPHLTRLRSSSPAQASSPRSSSLPPATQALTPTSSRRKWWRDLISSDPRYGLIDKVLKPEYPTPFVPTPRGPAPDDWKTPKLAGKRHPFHPDVAHYCRRSGGRVHWVIPVHGPVVLPGWGDPVAGGRTPFTSRGEINPDSGEQEGQASARPAKGKEEDGEGRGDTKEEERKEKARPVLWTPSLLEDFVSALVDLQHAGRYGRLTLRPSGPKPDPFLPSPSPSVPSAHSYLPKRKPLPEPEASKSPSSEVGGSELHGHPERRQSSEVGSELFTPESPPPVGVECGDHIRIYVDAHRALSLRTWLGHWREGHMAKCRLALVAASGECLIVA